MKIKAKYTSYILIILFSLSCTSILNINNQKVKLKKLTPAPVSCDDRKKAGPRQISKSEFITSEFYKTIRNNKLNLTQVEVFSLLVLTQLNLRPDVVSFKSEIQLLITSKNKNTYYDFDQKNAGEYPLYSTLKFLLKKSKSKYSLLRLAKISTKLFPGPYKISKGLANNLFKYQDSLKNHSIFLKTYFKSNQVLRAGETFEGLNLISLVKNINQKKLISNISLNYHSSSFIETNENPRSKLYCNQNLNLFTNGKYNITKDSGENFLPIGFSFKKGENILAVIKTKLNNNISPSFNSPIFKTESTDAKATFCYNKEHKKTIQIMSFRGRDSSQYIRNFLLSNIDQVQTQSELSQIIEFPRSLFLINPKRYIFESDRSEQKSIQSILSNDFPVYHSDTLGEVWAMIDSQSRREFITDTRHQSFHLCN